MLNFDELEKGFTEKAALAEARRCLMLCVGGCPVENRKPEIIAAIKEKDCRKTIDAFLQGG